MPTNEEDDRDNTPSIAAVELEDTKMVDKLLAAGIDKEIIGPAGNAPLQIAAK